MTPLTATEVVFTIRYEPAGVEIAARPRRSALADRAGVYRCAAGQSPYSPQARAAALADLNRKLMEAIL